MWMQVASDTGPHSPQGRISKQKSSLEKLSASKHNELGHRYFLQAHFILLVSLAGRT